MRHDRPAPVLAAGLGYGRSRGPLQNRWQIALAVDSNEKLQLGQFALITSESPATTAAAAQRCAVGIDAGASR